jgi:hypothetical protein
MRDALNRTGKAIVYSFEPHLTVPIAWPAYVGNLWRTGNDIGSNYAAIFNELIVGNAWASVGGPGHWNDDDMLEVGNPGLSIAEQRTHFALWCMVKSPLMVLSSLLLYLGVSSSRPPSPQIGSDVRSISNNSLALLLNRDLIAINQDKLGAQVTSVSSLSSPTYYPNSNISNPSPNPNPYSSPNPNPNPNPNLLNFVIQAELVAVYSSSSSENLLAGTVRESQSASWGPFETNSGAVTTCDYGAGVAPTVPYILYEYIRVRTTNDESSYSE